MRAGALKYSLTRRFHRDGDQTNMLSPSAQKVQAALLERGFGHLVVQELSDSTRTAQEAAAAVGCAVEQIVKSLVFRGTLSGKAYLFLVSGANRVDESKAASITGEPLSKADAGFVRGVTGFAIGGVPPLGHTRPMETLIDPDLLLHTQIWAAAGTPAALFSLSPDELVAMTGGRVVAVK